MAVNSKIISHLCRDKVLMKVIARHDLGRRKKNTDLYLSLMRAVVGQQLSVKAAQTIWQRFIGLFNDHYPVALKVLRLSDETLRSVGLSYQKASYVKNIARFSQKNSLDYAILKKMPDDELIQYLASIKGVGKWTVEMILMFNLQRQDIFPVDDLGIQNAIKMLYRIDEPDRKKLLAKMESTAENWRPYRTIACFYLWKHKDSVKQASKA
jgi:DNA-3-methyladenine glycosylase II